MEWKEYPNERLIAKNPNGFYIIKQKNDLSAAQVPIFCPLCGYLMNSTYDEESYKKNSCCDECSNVWVYPNAEKWNEGWRPSIEDVKRKSTRIDIDSNQ